MTTRLRLICHAATAATRAVAFADDEPVDARALQKLAGLAPLRADRHLTSPALRARETAAALLGEAVIDPALRDCEYGRWSGRPVAAVQAEEPDALAAWLRDPAAAPHGGESVTRLIMRVGGWLDAQAARPGTVAAVTHAAVIRAAIVAALHAAATAYGHLDVAPLSQATLSHHAGRWTLTGLGPLERLG